MLTYADGDYIVRLCYTSITIILYLLLCAVMTLHKNGTQFQTAFYKIFKTTIWINMLAQVTWLICPKSVNPTFTYKFVAIFPDRGFFTTLIPFLQYYSYYSMVMLELLISFNRFSAVVLGLAYNDFWRRYFKFFIFACLGVPGCLTWHFWVTDVYLQEQGKDSDVSFFWDQHDKGAVPWLNVQYVSIILLSISGILSFIFNVYAGIYLWKQPLNMHSSTEKKLFVYSVMMFISIVLNMAKNVIIQTASWPVMQFIFIYLDYGNDFAFLMPPWFMLAINSEIRKSLKHFLCGSKAKVTPVSSVKTG